MNKLDKTIENYLALSRRNNVNQTAEFPLFRNLTGLARTYDLSELDLLRRVADISRKI
jgi:hypothetical protein